MKGTVINMNEEYSIKILQGIDACPDARRVRKAVFVKELNCKDEFDDIDLAAFHIVIYSNNQPVAAARTYQDDDSRYVMSRVCVMKPERRKAIGTLMIRELERFIKTTYNGEVKTYTNKAAEEFFTKLGYAVSTDSPRRYGDDCILLVKTL